MNRVFDSAGPEGKVRGTPQQIIEKYTQLANDAQLANDRVAAESFQQHAEHYTRLLSEAQREIDTRREQQEREHRERQQQRNEQQQHHQQNAQNTQTTAPEQAAEPVAQPPEQPQSDAGDPSRTEQPGLAPVASKGDGDNGLVATPEQAPVKQRRPRKPRAKPVVQAEAKPESPDVSAPETADATETPETPKAAE